MFHFMKKEKTEEERAEKEKRKKEKKDRKDRKSFRDHEKLTAEELQRLEEVRKSLKVSAQLVFEKNLHESFRKSFDV